MGFTKHIKHLATSRHPQLKGKQCITLLGPRSVNCGNVCAAGQGFKRHDSWQISVKIVLWCCCEVTWEIQLGCIQKWHQQIFWIFWPPPPFSAFGSDFWYKILAASHTMSTFPWSLPPSDADIISGCSPTETSWWTVINLPQNVSATVRTYPQLTNTEQHPPFKWITSLHVFWPQSLSPPSLSSEP